MVLRPNLSVNTDAPRARLRPREIREAIEFHLDGLREDGLPIPPPSSAVRYVDIAA